MVVVILLFRAGLVRVEEAVACARKEGQVDLVGDVAQVGLVAVEVDGEHVDSARTCGGARGSGVASRDCVAVLFACHVNSFVAGWS